LRVAVRLGSKNDIVKNRRLFLIFFARASPALGAGKIKKRSLTRKMLKKGHLSVEFMPLKMKIPKISTVGILGILRKWRNGNIQIAILEIWIFWQFIQLYCIIAGVFCGVSLFLLLR